MSEPPLLTVITDRSLCGSDLPAQAELAARAGAPALQLREKDLDALSLYELAVELRRRLTDTGAALYVNDRADIAAAAGAQGVQLRADALAPRDVRGSFPGLAIGLSVHGLAEARAAQTAGGVDFVMFGPVFDTASKRAYGPAQGLDKLAAVCRAISLPVVAVGGITPERVAEVLAHGARGVAAIGAVWADPARAVRRFMQALRTPRRGGAE